MAAHAAAHHDDACHHHVSSWVSHALVLAILLFLTALTVVTAKYVDLGETGNIVLAMVIATTKATLVGAFFMHLLYDRGLPLIVLLYSLITVGCFLLFTVADVVGRNYDDPINQKVVHPTIVQDAKDKYISTHGADALDHGAESGKDHH